MLDFIHPMSPFGGGGTAAPGAVHAADQINKLPSFGLLRAARSLWGRWQRYVVLIHFGNEKKTESV